MYKVLKILNLINYCEITCNQMAATIINEYNNLDERRSQLKELRNCAEQCISSSILLANSSRFSNESLSLLCKVSDSCANECLKYTDEQSQYCGKVCYQMADECKQFLTQWGWKY